MYSRFCRLLAGQILILDDIMRLIRLFFDQIARSTFIIFFPLFQIYDSPCKYIIMFKILLKVNNIF